MSAEIWAIVTVGIAILVAIAASNRALRREVNGHITELRREMNERFEEVGRRFEEVNEHITAVRLEMAERFGEVRQEMNERFVEVNERITAVRLEMLERFGEVGERLGRVEGLLEGMGFAQRKRAAKERSDGER